MFVIVGVGHAQVVDVYSNNEAFITRAIGSVHATMLVKDARVGATLLETVVTKGRASAASDDRPERGRRRA